MYHVIIKLMSASCCAKICCVVRRTRVSPLGSLARVPLLRYKLMVLLGAKRRPPRPLLSSLVAEPPTFPFSTSVLLTSLPPCRLLPAVGLCGTSRYAQPRQWRIGSLSSSCHQDLSYPNLRHKRQKMASICQLLHVFSPSLAVLSQGPRWK